MSDLVPTVPAEEGFDPILFWERHSGKIILFGALFVVALVLWAVSQYATQHQDEAAMSAFAAAKTPDDLRKVSAEFPESIPGGNAELLLADQLRADKKYEEAVTVLQKFIAAHPEHPLASGAWVSLGATQELQGKGADALASYQQATVKYPDTFGSRAALLRQANLLQAQGKPAEARRVYENIIAQQQGTYAAQVAQQSLTLLPK